MNSNREPLHIDRHSPLQILSVSFNDLCKAVREKVSESFSHLHAERRLQQMKKLDDFIFNLESLVFLDGEHRADSIMSRLLRWSGPGFTRRFYRTEMELDEDVYKQDQRFVTEQFHELLNVSHYRKLSPEMVEQSISNMSYEKIFVRLQNVGFLNFFVRGSYIARQRETITRLMAKRIPTQEKWVSTFFTPEAVEVFEEVVVIASEEIPRDEECREERMDEEAGPCCSLDEEQMDRELAPYLQEEERTNERTTVKRRRAIQRLVKEKMRSLQGKTLDEIMAEHTPDPNRVKHLHLLVYHNIPASDLELLLPNAEISLGVKEYVQLCFTGTATLPALGKVILTRGLRKLMMVFNPIFFGIYRVLYKINVVRTEQKFMHARYLLNHRLAKGGKAVSHLIDDYENVLKREAVLIFVILATERSAKGLTREELEEKAMLFVSERWSVSFEARFARSLRLLRKWGIVLKTTQRNIQRYRVPCLDELVAITSISRENVRGKIWLE